LGLGYGHRCRVVDNEEDIDDRVLCLHIAVLYYAVTCGNAAATAHQQSSEKARGEDALKEALRAHGVVLQAAWTARQVFPAV